MYPALHKQVARLLEEDDLFFTFHKADDAEKCIKEHDTTVMGRFVCHKSACDATGWSSKMIAITIRMYPDDQYNVRVYHQRCESCNGVSRPFLDGSYAERTAWRLKKWSGIKMELPSYSKKSKGPHNESLCEGCKHGRCNRRK